MSRVDAFIPLRPATDRKTNMTSIRALRVLSLAGLGCMAATAPHAQDAAYFYGGLSLGQSRSKIDERRINSNLLDSGLATTSMNSDETSGAYKFFGGYQFNRHVALEGGYFNLGKFSFRSTTEPEGTLEGSIKLQGVNLDLVGTLPVTDRFSVIGRAGAQYAKARDTFRATGAVSVLDANPSRSEWNPKLGIGVQYEASPAFLVRGELERYRVNDAVGHHGGINVFSVSLVFPFGRAPARQMAAAPAPAYVPQAEPMATAPPVAVAAAPPPPVIVATPRRVHFSADSLFAFDHSDIAPDGKASLDAFAKELQQGRFDTISVDGHTDRLGSQAYNQALSERRAQAVKQYLVTSLGVDAAKVTATGRGESAPTTKVDDCKGSKANPALVACLRADRRVVVEVSGTR